MRHTTEALRLARATQQVVAHPIEREVPRHSGKRLRSLTKIQHVRHLGRLPREPAALAVRDPDESIGFRERERPKQQRIDDAEDRRTGAYSKSGDQNHERGKAGVTAQAADGIPEITHECFEAHGPLDGFELRNVGG